HSAWRMPSFVGSVESAVLLFSLRTILRSRQHRILLSFYLGAGFGVMLILLRPSMAHGGNPAVPLLVASVLMLVTTAAAIRSVFSMPIALRANWIFRIAPLDPVTRYTAAIRRTFLLLAVAPVCSCFAVAT